MPDEKKPGGAGPVGPAEVAHFDKPVKVLVVQAGPETAVNAALAEGARAVLAAAGVEIEEIAVLGMADLPQALALAERMQDFDAYVALGAVIDSPSIWGEVARALSALGMSGALNGNGVVLAETAEEALEMADPKGIDVGGGAARSALSLVALARGWSETTKGIGFRA